LRRHTWKREKIAKTIVSIDNFSVIPYLVLFPTSKEFPRDVDVNNNSSRREAITFSAAANTYLDRQPAAEHHAGHLLGLGQGAPQPLFLSSTHLAGSSSYHGNAIAIKGRIAAVVLIGGYNIAFQVSPIIGLIMLVLMMAVLPWLIWKSLQFAVHQLPGHPLRLRRQRQGLQVFPS
jgi:hypothetical protein